MTEETIELMFEAYEALQKIVALNELQADLAEIDLACADAQVIIGKIEGKRK